MSEEQRGRRHGPIWLITYCDMVTLLIACFILIITLTTTAKERHAQRKGSPSAGVAGETRPSDNRDAIVWRLLPGPVRIQAASENPPLHADPNPEPTTDVIRRLEADHAHTLANSYHLRIPFVQLFDTRDRLTPAGIELLRTIARNVRPLPYDLLFQVDDAPSLGKAMAIAQHVAQKEAMHPGRIGVGLRTSPESWTASLWITLTRRPS